MNESEEYVKSLDDYIGIIKRRKLALILPALVIFAMAIAFAFGLPAIYQSQATILIQQQKIPREFVRSTVTSFASQQIQIISQRVLTVKNIYSLVEKYNLYQQVSASDKLAPTELAMMFREDMQLEMVSAEIIDPRSGRASEATIAFTLAFNNRSRNTAQQVTNELVTLFLNDNLQIRTDQAASTEDFFASEAANLNEELLKLEQGLADFKTENEGALPELANFNLSALERTDRQFSDMTFRMQELEKRKIELSSRLAQLSPSSAVVLPGGEVVLSDTDRLKALQSDYRRKAAIYSENHPDVVRLQREVEALQAELGVETDVEDLRNQLQDQKRLLADLQSRYNDNHQDVQSTQRLVAFLEQSIDKAGNASEGQYAPKADNPAYVLLETQLSTIDSELRSLALRKAELEEKALEYEELIKRGPSVERDYQALLRDYNLTSNKYEDLKSKQREAAVSTNLEEGRKGERFVLIEPAALPSIPVSPNRPAIIFLGLVLSMGAGLGTVLVREAMDGSLHGVRELTAIIGEAPLAAIPYIENETDIQKNQRSRRIMLMSMLVAASLLVLYVHFFYKPLDVLYFVILKKLGIS